jgi:HEAT repeat protein
MTRSGRHVRSWVLSLSVLLSVAGHIGCVQDSQSPSVERGVALLVALLHDDSWEIRRTAAEALGKIGHRSAVSALLPLLSDPEPRVRAAAARALGRMASTDDDAVMTGLSRSLGDPDNSVRHASALAIGDIEPSPRRLTPVADFLRSSDVEVRRAAVRALLGLDTGQITEWLLPMLDDQDAEVRQMAVAALGFSGHPRAGSALVRRLMHDPSPAVRVEAAYHLGELNGQDTRTVLQTAIVKESHGGVRRWIEEELRGLRAND